MMCYRKTTCSIYGNKPNMTKQSQKPLSPTTPLLLLLLHCHLHCCCYWHFPCSCRHCCHHRCGRGLGGSEAVWCCLVVSVDRWFGFILFAIQSTSLPAFRTTEPLQRASATVPRGDGCAIRRLAFRTPFRVPQHQHTTRTNPSTQLPKLRTEN